MAQEKDQGQGLVVGGVGGTVIGTFLGLLMAAKPAEAAPPEEKLNFLIEALTALIQVLAEVAGGQTTLINLMQQWLAAQGIAPPGLEITVSTPWEAKEPEEIFNQPIRVAAVFFSDRMVDWTKGKRLVIKAESSLDQACQIQVTGNTADTRNLAADIPPMLPCPANSNVSIGLAWDNWHPYIGVRIVTALAPTAGILTISAVIQK